VLELAGTEQLHKIVVLNPKGGSGKTTLAFNLAGYLASTGRSVALLDMDLQGSSGHWLQNRPSTLAPIQALSPAASDRDGGRFTVPEGVEFVVVDAPAGLSGEQLIDYTCGAHAILIPVLPSDLDIHAASRLISKLLLVAQVSRRNGRLGIIANRVKEHTIAYRQLTRFLNHLSIARVGVLRDSQNYTRAAANGRCIHEMAPSQVKKDLVQWQAITEWLEKRLATPLTPRDLRRPAAAANNARRAGPALWFSAAAAISALAIAVWFLSATKSTQYDEPLPAVASTVAFQNTTVVPITRRANEEPEPPAVSPGEALRQRWELTGVARASDVNVLMLSDRQDHTTVRLTDDNDLDGWVVKESGPDFAVLGYEGDEVRLLLNED
jgi:chromosome partitioning protein